MDFSGFSSPKVANKRQGGGGGIKGQVFTDMKYRKSESKDKNKVVASFTIADPKFDALGLETSGIRYFINKANKLAGIGVTNNDDAQVMKASAKQKNGKGRKFKADTLEAALNEFGVIDSALVNTNQYLSLKAAGTNVSVDGYTCSQFFLIEKGEAVSKATLAANQAGTDAQPVATKKAWD